MPDIVSQHNIAAYGSLRALSAPASATAGGSGAGVAVTGVTFDRESFANGSLPDAAEIGVLFDAVLASGHTLSLAVTINHSPDGVTWTAYQTQVAAVAATGNAGGTAQISQLNIPVDLTGAQRYLQVVVTPTFSASSVDTASFQAAGFFAGFDRLPASA